MKKTLIGLALLSNILFASNCYITTDNIVASKNKKLLDSKEGDKKKYISSKILITLTKGTEFCIINSSDYYYAFKIKLNNNKMYWIKDDKTKFIKDDTK